MSPSEEDGAVLFTRPDCPLCFSLKTVAARAARRHGLTLRVIDVSGDELLLSLYGNQVPVLVLPGGTTFRGRASSGEVERAFDAAARRPPPRGQAAFRRDAQRAKGRAGWLWRMKRALGLGPSR